jgi:hypothetical protein
MNIIQLINLQREVVGQIIWNAPDGFQITIVDAGLAAGISAFLAEAIESGLTLRSGQNVEEDGKIRFVDRIERITVNDKRFLRTLVDKINRVNFTGQRVFGLLKEEANHD